MQHQLESDLEVNLTIKRRRNIYYLVLAPNQETNIASWTEASKESQEFASISLELITFDQAKQLDQISSLLCLHGLDAEYDNDDAHDQELEEDRQRDRRRQRQPVVELLSSTLLGSNKHSNKDDLDVNVWLES